MFEEFGVFYRGLVLGIMIAAPVGPIGLLCIRRTLQRGLVIGLATGLGAACADTVFGAVAALGVSAILNFMRQYDAPIRMLGGVLLLAGALYTWRDRPEPPESRFSMLRRMILSERDETVWWDRFSRLAKAFAGSFAITLTNPVTMFAILAVVAAFGHPQSHADAVTLIGGVFSGSVLWWCLLSGGIALIRNHFTENRILLVNRITASVLALLGVWALVSGVQGFVQHGFSANSASRAVFYLNRSTA